MKHYILSIIAFLVVFGTKTQVSAKTNKSNAMAAYTYAPLFEQNKFLSLSFGGGFNTFLYDCPYGTSSIGVGGRFNIDYNIFVSRVCGITFGIGGSKYSSSVTLNNDYTAHIDAEANDYHSVDHIFDGDCKASFRNWKETQNALALEVPIGALFRKQLGNKNKLTFLGGAGAKFTFPMKSSYSVTDQEKQEMSIYVKDLNLNFEDAYALGIATPFDHPSGDCETKLMSLGAYLDLNFVHKIGKIEMFYGLYFDYGLTDIAKKEQSLITLTEYNGLLNSDAVESVKPFSAGLRLGFKISCPRLKDQDKDGVMDIRDKCPNTPLGLSVDTCGCPPDTDGDGVPDYKDQCANTPREASVDTCGCPLDTDGDGVPDYIDMCPKTPKNIPVDSRGCSLDTDGDGVPDYLDKCNDTPIGVNVDAYGCPPDTDGDGVPDYIDKCPTIPGVAANQGCPGIAEYVRQLFKDAEHGIEFQSGTATLKRSTCRYIDDIIRVMNEHPSYILVINAHTDSSLSTPESLKLSKRRARAIADYMVEHGIYPNRVKNFGYGSSQPISDNNTAVGRKLNNRIEFMVEFEQ